MLMNGSCVRVAWTTDMAPIVFDTCPVSRLASCARLVGRSWSSLVCLMGTYEGAVYAYRPSDGRLVTSVDSIGVRCADDESTTRPRSRRPSST